MSAAEQAARVVLAQDEAWGETDVDFDAWMETLTFPMTEMDQFHHRVIRNRAEARAEMERLVSAIRADGGHRVRTLILMRVQISETTVQVATIRQLMSKGQGVMAETPATWTVVKTSRGWRIKEAFFDRPIYVELTEPRSTRGRSVG